MRETEDKQTQVQAAEKKLPYNLRERKIVKAAYREMIRAELADKLYDDI